MKNLLTPLESEKINLHNRLIMPPMATSKAESDGKINQGILDYYDEKSRGGYISLFIIEHAFVAKEGKADPGQLSVASDDMVEGLKKLADVIHKNGSKAIMQINHAGSAADSEVTGLETVSSSDVVHPRLGNISRELSKAEIKTIVDQFKEAVIRVKKAGFDGVEIHSAHGYLLNQFFSPITNKRTDEYGGHTLDRIKIHLEVIEAIREGVGEDFPVLIRLGASDYKADGTNIEDGKIACEKFEEAGIDILDISAGLFGYAIEGLEGQGFLSPLTEAIKEVVSIPVILTGGITEAEAASDLIKDGKTDLVGVGRAIYKDSKWAENAIKSLED